MSALPVVPLTDIDVPHDDQAMAVWDQLQADTAQMFVRDLLRSIVDAGELGDARPMQETIEAWYRTLLILKQPGGAATVNRAMKGGTAEGEPLTLDQVREVLGRARARR